MRHSQVFLFILLTPLFSSCGLFSLLNSGTAHIKYSETKIKYDGAKYRDKDNFGNVSISVRNVQHPRAFGKWNFNVRLRPSIHYDRKVYETKDQRFNYNTGVVEGLPDLTIKRLITFGNLKFTFHTPIGAFALQGGFGGRVAKMYDAHGTDTFRTSEVRKLDLAWVGFLSKHFFVLMGPRYYKEQYEQFIFAFRLGYFWGPTDKKI